MAVLHLVAIWALGANLYRVAPFGVPREIHMVLFGPAAVSQPSLTAPAPPPLESPQVAEIVAPDFSIDADASPEVDSDGAAMLVPPRPDISKAHILPRLPTKLGYQPNVAPPVLRILITADGKVGQAIVVRSSGLPQVDAVALSFVKSNWHYVPAELDGRPVEDWITVVIHFADQSIAAASR